MEPFSQNTPAIDLITGNQSAFENTSSSFSGSKLTGLSIDTLGNQDIAKVELEIYFSDVVKGSVLPFECAFPSEVLDGVSLTKSGISKYTVHVDLGERELDQVVHQIFDQFEYSLPEDLAGQVRGHINIRNKNAINDWSTWETNEFDLAISPISEVPLAEIEALSDLNHDGRADNHPNFYVNKDVLLKFNLKFC